MSFYLGIKPFLIKITKRLHVYDFLRQINRGLNKQLLISEQIQCDKLWLGDNDNVNYGGFYICPTPITSNSVIYSGGIGLDISFETDLINRFGCKVFGFDPTPRSINFIKKHPISNFIFFPYGLNNKDGQVDFHLPKDPQEFVSGSIKKMNHLKDDTLSVPMKKISSIMRELNHTKIDILKLDIEGAEYRVIDDILNNNIHVNQITLEFHHWLIPKSDNITRRTIKKLNKSGYFIFGISPSGLEVSFIKCHKGIPFFLTP